MSPTVVLTLETESYYVSDNLNVGPSGIPSNRNARQIHRRGTQSKAFCRSKKATCRALHFSLYAFITEREPNDHHASIGISSGPTAFPFFMRRRQLRVSSRVIRAINPRLGGDS